MASACEPGGWGFESLRERAQHEPRTDRPVRARALPLRRSARAGGGFIGEALTAAILAPQGVEEVFVDWTVPADVLSSGENRIFVELIAQETEIRSENNLGWAALPAIAVPEPDATLLGGCVLVALRALRWRRRARGELARA